MIEDVFVGSGRAVRKPDWLPDPGLAAAARLVRRGGLLVSNAIDESPQVSRRMRALFPSSVRIAIEDYDNVVWVGGPSSLSAQGLRAAAAAHPLLSPDAGAALVPKPLALDRPPFGARHRIAAA